MKWLPVTTIVSTTASGYTTPTALTHAERAYLTSPYATPRAKPAWRLGTAATGFENGDECGEPMSIPEKARSVSVRPASARRGGAVGNFQWMNSETAVAMRKPLRTPRKLSRDRK